MNNFQKKVESATPQIKQTTNNLHSFTQKEHYYMFFIILFVSFFVIFWLCNFTKLRETFQIIMMSALSISIAEYSTRKYFKL